MVDSVGEEIRIDEDLVWWLEGGVVLEEHAAGDLWAVACLVYWYLIRDVIGRTHRERHCRPALSSSSRRSRSS